ncbi:MAG: phosphodiester glycosidase family protein [Clostridiales bacterium]|nr:phosphodiester glycosidase family protein [Clostridiales bacterium]
MKRLLCLLLTLMLLPLPALAEEEEELLAAAELDVILKDNRTELDQTALRDNSDSTGYEPKSASSYIFSTEISGEQPLYQVFLRMNSLPASAEIQVKNAKDKYVTVATVTSPGPEFVLSSSEPITGSIRLVIRFEKAVPLHLKECRLFGQGGLPASLHQWRRNERADVLLMTDALTDADPTALKTWSDAGASVAIAALTAPSGEILAQTDALWEAGLRLAPLYGDFRAMEGDAAQKLKTWKEKPVLKTLTEWTRCFQPLLLLSGSEVTQTLLPTVCENAYNYNYETESAAEYGLWIVPDSCHVTDDVTGHIAALAPRSYDALRAWCAEDFASAQHGDPATIPYPADRLSDGYLAEGEFVHEDPDNGLWAYLSPTVQVEIIRYEQPEFPRVWFETDVKFKPETEKFQQVLYANASFEGQQIYPETLAQTSGMVLAINGDYYPYRLDRKQAAGNILRNYKPLYDYSDKNKRNFPNLDTLALLDDGTLQVYAGNEITASQLAERGNVHDALSFGPYLVRNGEMRIYDGSSWDTPEPRCAIGMIGAGHYRILTVEGRMPKGGARGLNVNDLSKLMYSQGVSDGFNLDGGSTMVLIFMGRKLNLTGKDTSIGKPRNQHELFGVGTSTLTHTDMLKSK